MGLAADEVRHFGASRHVALLRTREPSPAREAETSSFESVDGKSWLVGRLRLDDCRAAPARRCLDAYRRAGDQFLDGIAGDFCFVLWDEARQRLVAARDQLGVRALFHARVGNTWVVSDSLGWLQSWKALDTALDDYWVVDFLSFGHALDFDSTVRRDVKRLPPAHVLEVGGDSRQGLRRYWRLSIGEPLYHADHRRYGEEFRALVAQAITDRLPDGRIGITMSGGLDSTTLAALAVEASGRADRLLARCYHLDNPAIDDEPRFAALAASHLGIALELAPSHGLRDDPHWRSRGVRTAEPWNSMTRAGLEIEAARSSAAQAAVWFEGEGPDNALVFERGPYFAWLRRQRRWGRLLEAGWLYLRAKGLTGLQQTLRRYTGRDVPPLPPASLPPWLNPDLVRALDLEERLARHERGSEPPHPWHPRAVGSFGDPIWQGILADCDVEETLAPFVWRHPYLDLRVLQFLLSVPPVPWARRKLLMREAMTGRLPAQILARDKKTFPLEVLPGASDELAAPEFAHREDLGRWIDLEALSAPVPFREGWRRLSASHALDYWLGMR